jgi:hypothetical protein
MSHHRTPMIKKNIRHESLVYETLFDIFIGDALRGNYLEIKVDEHLQ